MVNISRLSPRVALKVLGELIDELRGVAHLRFDLALKDELTGPLTAAKRYVAATGSDTEGTGSATAPWRTFQRGIDAVPPGTEGYYNLQALDAGPFTLPYVGELAVAGLLHITLIGAGDSILDLSGMAAGTAVPLPAPNAAADKQTVLDHIAAGAHTVVANGTHWVRAKYTTSFFPEGGDFFAGETIDGTNSPSPDLRLFDGGGDITLFGYDEIDLVPYVTEIIADASGAVQCFCPAGRGVDLTLVGLFTDADTVLINGHVGTGAFASRSTAAFAFTRFSFDNVSDVRGLDLFCANPLILFGQPSSEANVKGLCLKQVLIRGLHCAWFHPTVRTTDSPKLVIGMPSSSASGPPYPASVMIGADFELTGAKTVAAYHSTLRLYDDGAFSTYDGLANEAIFADRFCHILNGALSGMDGSTAGVSVVLKNHTNALLLSSEHGTAPHMRNTASAGDDVTVGSKAVQTFASLAGGVTDVGEAVPQFCRST